MKKLILLCFVLLSIEGYSQSNFVFGAGYSAAWLKTEEFSTLLTSVNEANPGLTKTFENDNLCQGYSLFAGSKSENTSFILSYQQLFKKTTAEGIIPVISTDAGTYEIGTRHSSITMAYDYYFASFIALGAQFGYTYSTIRNAQYELAFGDQKSVVDKKGGLQGGINAILSIPLGSNAFFEIQPYYMLAFYDMDINNLANIYLGQGNSAPASSDLRGMGIDFRLGIKM